MPERSADPELMKAACALLDAGGSRGTGFLVSPERVLTCHHVVRSADDAPILVSFPHGQYRARVELVDAEHDCALLRLTQPVPAADARPLLLATEPAARGAAWEGYGFPAATGQAGLLIEGRIQDPCGQDPALRPAVVLRSKNVTAGSWLSGFSGSPVVVGGRVVGQMRQIIPDAQGGAQLAIVYACPAIFLLDLARRRLSGGPMGARQSPPGQAPDPAARPVFAVPQPLNPNFTGREQWLVALRQQLHERQTVALWGFGGIGKTQTAVAYAHRYRHEYAAVLWLPGDSPSSLERGLVELARPLLQAGRLRESLLDSQDPAAVRQAVVEHLQQTSDYLLICDNVDLPAALKPVWPRTLSGQILLTSRSQDVRRLGAVVLELGNLSLAESQALLARCYPPRGSEEEQALGALVQELDGLPLALGQAAAYLTRHRSRYEAYLRGYRQKKLLLLEKGLPDDDYPYSVASTWALSIEQIERTSRASAELLKLCALLQPDAIPEELFADPVPALGAVLREALLAQKDDAQALDELLAPLLCYALVQRDPDQRTLSLHRLVQQSLLHQMTEAEEQRWAGAAVAQVSTVFPPSLFTDWTKGRRLLPQALTMFEHIERFAIRDRVAGQLLHNAGYFLSTQAQHAEAELLVRRALSIFEQVHGEEHLDVASGLNTLGELLYTRAPLQELPSDSQTQYLEAELLVRRALTIREEALGAEHPEVANSLNNLAALLQRRGKLPEAEQFLRRAMSILEGRLGDQHPDVARSFNNLGLFLHGQGQLAEAEELYRRALTIWDQSLGPEHPAIAYVLCNLGLLLEGQHRRTEAASLYQRALAIREKGLPADHPLIERTRQRLQQVTLAGPWRELSSD